METVMVSPQFQVVIPPNVRESLGIQAGQEIQLIQYQGRIELIPLKPVRAMRGFLKGIDTSVERDIPKSLLLERELSFFEFNLVCNAAPPKFVIQKEPF